MGILQDNFFGTFFENLKNASDFLKKRSFSTIIFKPKMVCNFKS